MKEDDSRLEFISLEDLTKPPKGQFFECYRNYWWTKHPEKGFAVFRRKRSEGVHALANSDEAIARGLANRFYPWAEVEQVEQAYIPMNLNDWTER